MDVTRPSPAGASSGARPLEGITVVSVEQAVAAPFASRHLADLGARVIKIERPGVGDFARSYDTVVNGLSSHFVWLNRSKESLALDLKSAGSRSVLERLLERADVFLHNLGPGAAERLGLDAPTLRGRYPRLIVCTISGYGSTGPYGDRKAYDLWVQAESGLMSITGSEQTPSKVGIPVADIAAGSYAYSGVLAALIARGRTGEGAALEVSLLDALAEWMGFPLYYTAYSGAAPRRSGPRHAAIAPYGPFRCGDGNAVFLAVQNEREWSRFCEHVLGDATLATDPRYASGTQRVANSDALTEYIEGIFGARTAQEVHDALEAAGMAHAEMNGVEEFLDHPQLESRDRWCEVDSVSGKLRTLLPPVTTNAYEPALGPIPEVGQHSETILEELGFDAAEIAELRQAQVI